MVSSFFTHDNGDNLELLPWKHGKQRLFGGSGGSSDPVLPRACSEVLNADSPLILAASTTATIRRVLSWLMNRTMNRIMSRSNEPDSGRIPRLVHTRRMVIEGGPKMTTGWEL
jgi:precorrin-6B methylase 2